MKGEKREGGNQKWDREINAEIVFWWDKKEAFFVFLFVGGMPTYLPVLYSSVLLFSVSLLGEKKKKDSG